MWNVNGSLIGVGCSRAAPLDLRLNPKFPGGFQKDIHVYNGKFSPYLKKKSKESVNYIILVKAGATKMMVDIELAGRHTNVNICSNTKLKCQNSKNLKIV